MSDAFVSMAWRVGVVLWTAFIATGFCLLARYEATPGAVPGGVATWPAATRLSQFENSLVMFVHPECSCTRASITELCRMLAKVQRPPAVQVVMVGTGDGLRHAVASVPEVIVVEDPAGSEARRFGATTSGHLCLFVEGRARFHGGITKSRGHEGCSVGAVAVVAHLGGRSALCAAPVFGCPLFGGTV